MLDQNVTPEMLADVIAEETFENRPVKKPHQLDTGEQLNRMLGMLLGPFTLIVAIMWAMGCFDGSINQEQRSARSESTRYEPAAHTPPAATESRSVIR